MFFAKLSVFAAYLCLAFGAWQITLGVLGGSIADFEAVAHRYFGTAASGEAIDRGTMLIGLAIVFGAIWEIYSLLKQINDKSN
ncbi:hypothetical protein GCM10007094_41090 [Pseudovibrio japonicus]|uniref:Uncharacterized protein n=1 Tax=Pseudovibrio japonicus TaxID=366534 RepID=A0ABQ3EUH0_9HYPH|nr:hypothetical protein [Pseudovibrio japonicus]GHB47582.1 hypothetical protein GCM10007094_41090 [Pseudovibrio japonicus]